MLKFNLKVGLKVNSSTKTEFKTELKTDLLFEAKVNLNNPVLNQLVHEFWQAVLLLL